jgi:hypothetical protein
MANRHTLWLGLVALVGCNPPAAEAPTAAQRTAAHNTVQNIAQNIAPAARVDKVEAIGTDSATNSATPSSPQPPPGSTAQQQLLQSILRELALEAQLQEATDAPQRTAIQRQLEELRLERSTFYSPSPSGTRSP